jgi:hypothetical protein
MAARTFGSLPISCVTSAQLQALAEKNIGVGDISDGGCTDSSLNTCERDANDLLSQYHIYDSTRGVYTSWGNIPLSWDFENTASDERWRIARYVDESGYRSGDRVLVITNDGLLVTLYEAVANGPSPAGPFDLDLWVEVCHVTTSVPVGLPDIATLVSRYPYYDPRAHLTQWGEFQAGWNDDLSGVNSDTWGEARIAKAFFYRRGDTVLYDTSCDDYTCAYIATVDMPSDPDLVVPGPPPPSYFDKLYCVVNGRENTCVRRTVCGPGRVVVDLSSGDRDPVCVPVESTTAVGPRFS